VDASSDEATTMDDDLRGHLTGMLARLRPLVDMADRSGVPSQVAARLRAAAMEIEGALDPGATERRAAGERERDRDNMEAVRSGEREGRGWGIDEA
jgi:hypothetical protein